MVTGGLRAAVIHDAEGTAGGDQVRLVAMRLFANAVAAGEKALLRCLAPSGPVGSTCLATRSVASVEQAASANAAAVTMTQCDEGLREARGHPGLHAFSAAMAMVEMVDGTVGDMLSALAAGWEVGARLGLALGPVREGIHPHGGWGAAASAASAAVALGLDDTKITEAVANALGLGLVGPDSSVYAGDDSHFLLPAIGAATGVTAARATAAGVTAPARALEHFSAVAHQDGAKPASIDPFSGESMLRLAYLKSSGICAHALVAWELAKQLGSSVEVDHISGVLVETYAGAARLSGRAPATRLARQFSLPWAVASGLLGQHPDGAHSDAVRDLAGLVNVQHDPALDEGYPAGRPTHLTVQMRDGRVIRASGQFHLGDRERPLSHADAAAIDARLLGSTRDAATARAAYEGLGGDPGQALRSVTRALTGGSPTIATPKKRST
jgi:2-methylcitrate dehydratase PrpD